MAKIYENQKTHLTTCSGEVTEISADRLSFKIKSQKYNRETKKNEEEIKEWKGATPLPESVKVGKNATAVGCYVANPLDPASEGYQAAYVSAENESFEYKTLAVVNGQIVFARYNEEKNEDGTPKMKKERLGADGVMIPAEPRKPHFDIGISTKETDENGQEIRVLHTIKTYANNGDTSQIERFKKLFANFDKETNPAYATIVTRPGQRDTRDREYNGTTYQNHYCNHMGVNSIDVVYEKNREKTQGEAKAEEPAPAPTPAPAPAVQTDAIPPVETPAPVAAPVAEGSGLTAEVAPSKEDDDLFI